jgi:plasmid stabilization system protein ParE
MKYHYRLSTSAARELDWEISYSAERWGKKHAKLYRDGLLSIIKSVVVNPFLYPERLEIGIGCRIVRYKGNYIIYSVNEEEKYIEIIAFPSIHRSILH